MFGSSALALLSLALAARAQQVGTYQAEVHPSLPMQTCTASGCTTVNTKIVIDSNWRWVHAVGGYTNCYTGNTWNTTACPDGNTCVQNCAVDGADYADTYGITTSGNALTMKFVTQGSSSTSANIGSRVYLMSDDSTYQMFKLLNREFSFDVDVSNLPCGLNGALYFSQMSADGGLSAYPGNKAGAKYGTGYCDAQCPRDIKFINGVANVEGWTGSSNDANAGTGNMGTCCSEMDIWEANSQATAYTPHPCSVNGQTSCTGVACGAGTDRYNGVCDEDGCDFNSYRMGNTSFYGTGAMIDTKSKVSVITQFVTADGTDSGTLSEIRRYYVQNGKTFANSKVNIPGIDPVNSISDSFCSQQKSVFGDQNYFKTLGGLDRMGQALGSGMVLVMSLWDDHAADCLWLDSTYPTTSTALGATRGPCGTDTGVPKTMESEYPNSSVTYSNIKYGTLNSTFSNTGSTGGAAPPSGGSATTASQASSPSGGGQTVPKYGQCGGTGYTGATTCATGSTCKASNQYYSQCL